MMAATSRPRWRSASVAVGVGLCLALGGCETLPHDGPEARAILSTQSAYHLVNLDYQVAKLVQSAPDAAFDGLSRVSSDAPIDRIAPGDVLSVSIFEASGNLFNARQAPSGVPSGLDRLLVDDTGAVVIPYAGVVRVGGLSAGEAGRSVSAALRGVAVDPQVIVQVVSSPANSVTVLGEVRNPGRFQLSANGDHLWDALASAGGPTRPPGDVMVELVRAGRTYSAPLSAVMNAANENVRLAPHDQIRLLYRARKFSTFGAFGRVAQMSIDDDTLSLAGAMSRSGGLDTNGANASAVFVFRFERPEVAERLGIAPAPGATTVPIVYRLNLREPAGYFVSNSFDVQADDLIYVARSGVDDVKKFLDLVNSFSQVTYNVRVTSALP
jgi:polysaccharide export outer membrane protein